MIETSQGMTEFLNSKTQWKNQDTQGVIQTILSRNKVFYMSKVSDLVLDAKMIIMMT